MTPQDYIDESRHCAVHKPEHHTRICEECIRGAFYTYAGEALDALERIKVIYKQRQIDPEVMEIVHTVLRKIAAVT